MVCGTPKQFHQRSLVIDHDYRCNNNNVKVWKIVRITNCDIDMKWLNAVGKVEPNRLVWCKVATNFQFVKSDMFKAQIKQDMPIYMWKAKLLSRSSRSFGEIIFKNLRCGRRMRFRQVKRVQWEKYVFQKEETALVRAIWETRRYTGLLKTVHLGWCREIV